jgi:beta-N-acetylhexosaminidase
VVNRITTESLEGLTVPDIVHDAHAVMLPVTTSTVVEPWLDDLLSHGTQALILGETRDEYVSRSMSIERQRRESASELGDLTAQLRGSAQTPLLIAVDQEPWGIARLHGLVPSFPGPEHVQSLNDDEIEACAHAVAVAARRMGITMFLAPVLDVLSGPNPWLDGRTLRLGHSEVARVAAAFVRGVQSAGVVTAAKHFPGFPHLPVDPVDAESEVPSGASTTADLEPFRAAIEAGTSAVMTGPSIVDFVDPSEPASTSRPTIDKLRVELGFTGLIISDDLDIPATTRGRTLNETAVASVDAGTDLLLLGGGDHLTTVVDTLTAQAQADAAFRARLSEAAERVRSLAQTCEMRSSTSEMNNELGGRRRW